MQFFSPDAAKDVVENQKGLLLDVREEYEFAEVRFEHLRIPSSSSAPRGAASVPADQLASLLVHICRAMQRKP